MPELDDMIAAVEAATNDEAVTAAGRFRPVGFVGKYFIGFFLGNAVGGVVGSDVGVVGAGVGGTAGLAYAGAKGGGFEFIVGVSPTHVHVVAPTDGGGYSKVHSFDRSHLEISAKSRAATRRLVLEDTDDDARIELEGVRLPGNHVSDVLHALVLRDHDDE